MYKFNREKLAEIMSQNIVSQVELARAIGVSQTFVHDMLKGFKAPSFDMSCRIAKHFDLKVDDFVLEA